LIFAHENLWQFAPTSLLACGFVLNFSYSQTFGTQFIAKEDEAKTRRGSEAFSGIFQQDCNFYLLFQEKRKRRDERAKIRERLGNEAAPKQVPRTIENTREPDATYVDIDDEEVGIPERLNYNLFNSGQA
jgi:hypothetical protein